MESTELGLKIDVQTRPLSAPYQLVAIGGDLDMHTAPKLKEALTALIEEGRSHLVLNLDATRYLDSTGLGVLIAVHNLAREAGGRIILICKSVRIQRLFIITGVTRVFDVFEDEEKMERRLGLLEKGA